MFTFANVNNAFTDMVRAFLPNNHNSPLRDLIVTRPSRNGLVYQVTIPVTVAYKNPCQRVLFNQARDANPFFHLYEAMWMLAGRSDVKPLSYYTGQIMQFSDDGKYLNGAYGFRWRQASVPWGRVGRMDQLGVLIEHLKARPDSRRAVLSMWNVVDDLSKIDSSRDVCCNLCVMFMINNNRLDMTVANRSNDMILGMFGANLVHFSFLQEYMASSIGVPVGIYYQFSNNLHVYEANYHPDVWLSDKTPSSYDGANNFVPLFIQSTDRSTFDLECVDFTTRHSADSMAGWYRTPFLRDVAQPMCIAFHFYKRKDFASALSVASTVQASDWRQAAVQWITKRKNRAAMGGVAND